MMTPEQEQSQLDDLIHIANNKVNITVESRIDEFKPNKDSPIKLSNVGKSFDSFIQLYGYTESIVSSYTNKIDYFDNVFTIIKELKDEIYNNSEDFPPPMKRNAFYSNMTYDIEGFFNSYKSEFIIPVIESYITDWLILAKKYNVDISDIMTNIHNNFEKLENINKELIILENELLEIPKIAKQVEFNFNQIMNEIKAPMNVDYIESHKKVTNYLNDESLLINKYKFESASQFFNNFKFNEIFYDLKENIYNIHTKIIESDNAIVFSHADKYKKYENNLSNNDQSHNITNFMLNKEIKEEVEDTIKFSMTTNKSQKYSEFIVFKDHSILIRDHKDDLILIRDSTQAKECIKDFFKGYINFKLHKNPTIAKKINSIISNNLNVNMTLLYESIPAINTLLDNEAILKSSKFDIIAHLNNNDYIENKYFDFEKLDDEMNKKINEHKIKQYAQSIISNKYKHLYNNDTYTIFKDLYELKLDPKLIQDRIGKKLAAFKNPEEFNDGLNKLLDSFNDFNLEAIMLKVNAQNINVISNNDNVLVIKIENFDQSKALGSSSWCISRDRHYFTSYTEDKGNQYFIYDFNKNSKDNNSLMGLTLYSDGRINTSHLKNDDYYEPDDYLKNLQLDIIKASIENYPLLTRSLKLLLNSNKCINIENQKLTKLNTLDLAGYPT